MEVRFGSKMWEALREVFGGTFRSAGQGNHYRGKTDSPHARKRLLAKRKAEREHRKRVRRQLAGRKHVR